MLAGKALNNETFGVYRFNEKSINTLFQILDLGEESFSSIALWHEDLYLGSSDGKVYKSRAKKWQSFIYDSEIIYFTCENFTKFSTSYVEMVVSETCK